MLDNANLIRKTRFPRQLVPLSVVATHLISFVVMLVVLLVVNFALLPRVRATEWLAIATRACDRRAHVPGSRSRSPSLNVLFRDIEFLVSALLAAALLPDADSLSARTTRRSRSATGSSI